MKYRRFEDLPVWRDAIRLAERVYGLVEHREFGGKGDLRNQLQRAALSVSNNIAEGFERGTTQELLTFLYYARGSAGEVRSMLVFTARQHWAEDFKSEISNLRSLAEGVSRQLRAWADSLQNSDIKGTRYLNVTVRAEHTRRERAAALVARLEACRLQAVEGQAGAGAGRRGQVA